MEFLQKEFPDVLMRLPELSITGDNAIMIAQASLMHMLLGNWSLDISVHEEIRASGNLSIASIK